MAKLQARLDRGKDRIHISRTLQSGYTQDLKIGFHRTVRVADNGGTNQLPPDLGRFPLYDVAQHALLPANIRGQGGFLLPMYQREAMWMSFRCSDPFTIKIYVGDVNAVSGESAIETQATLARRKANLQAGKEVQDYLVAPGQLWLDGIASADGKVRQFVATKMGSGYSVEAQITGEEIIGGLQIEATPSKVDLTKLDEYLARRAIATHKCDPLVKPIYIKTLTGPTLTIHVCSGCAIEHVKGRIQDKGGIPPDQQRLFFDGKELTDGSTVLSGGLVECSTVYLILRLRGGGDVRMGVASGGLIRQAIVKDTYDPTLWEPQNGIIFPVQILNSEGFEKVMGRPPPKTPVTATTYALHGLPYYSMYNEPVSNIRGFFQGLKSVNELDKEGKHDSSEKAKASIKVSQNTFNPIVLLNHKGERVGFRTISDLEKEVSESMADMKI